MLVEHLGVVVGGWRCRCWCFSSTVRRPPCGTVRAPEGRRSASAGAPPLRMRRGGTVAADRAGCPGALLVDGGTMPRAAAGHQRHAFSLSRFRIKPTTITNRRPLLTTALPQNITFTRHSTLTLNPPIHFSLTSIQTPDPAKHRIQSDCF